MFPYFERHTAFATTKSTQKGSKLSFTRREGCICSVLLCHACDLCTVTQNEPRTKDSVLLQMVNIFTCISDGSRGRQAGDASAVSHQSLRQCGPVRTGGGRGADCCSSSCQQEGATFPAAPPPPSLDCKSDSRLFPL